MKKRWADAPSPCVDVCKFRGPDKLCAGCFMTKAEKKSFKRLDGKAEKKAFFVMLVARIEAAGRFGRWSLNYRRRCERKGVPCPLDKIETPAGA
ncbi:DUF1289 domain-containing protein [Aurantimonas sp. Leaf443]|uniref:DUF1289 domain-containing protein n=1 Tax=Aurantimonas sp. Leaf443 TaxID=1736378 RepID=UPI0006F8DB13|nr:DUF1289 domain-containing protein [Aurantimonas sp. Leaf443]KQT85882.1 hypothetical protein ASG48_04545 [Aurantimonas sp. Leaf443]